MNPTKAEEYLICVRTSWGMDEDSRICEWSEVETNVKEIIDNGYEPEDIRIYQLGKQYGVESKFNIKEV